MGLHTFTTKEPRFGVESFPLTHKRTLMFPFVHQESDSPASMMSKIQDIHFVELPSADVNEGRNRSPKIEQRTQRHRRFCSETACVAEILHHVFARRPHLHQIGRAPDRAIMRAASNLAARSKHFHALVEHTAGSGNLPPAVARHPSSGLPFAQAEGTCPKA